MSVTLTLADEIDVSRGDMLVRPDNVPRVGSRLRRDDRLDDRRAAPPGSSTGSSTRAADRLDDALRYRIDVNTLHRQEARRCS